MCADDFIRDFFQRAEDDARINARHISMYFALVFLYADVKGIFFLLQRDRLMLLAKMSSRNTYHRSLRDLHAYGYLIYVPSFDPAKGSTAAFTY